MKSSVIPLFSIGVTTYNRQEMLKECLSSIFRQTFSDFEVIVGNDCPQEKLCAEQLRIHDPRVQFVNHARNLGPINNANALLEMSHGRYFTWLADDDMYTPAFLYAVHEALVKYDFPTCVFTSYMQGDTFPNRVEGFEGKTELFEGRQFLQRYLSGRLRAIGCYGAFDREYIRQIRGMEHLGNGRFSPYADNLLAIRSGLLERVGYIEAPLIFYRTHEGSVSLTSSDLEVYRSAQEDLCQKSIKILGSEGLRDDFHSNLFMLLSWCIRDFAAVALRSGSIDRSQAIAYLVFARRFIRLLRGSDYYWRSLNILNKTAVGLVWGFSKAKLKRWRWVRVMVYPIVKAVKGSFLRCGQLLSKKIRRGGMKWK